MRIATSLILLAVLLAGCERPPLSEAAIKTATESCHARNREALAIAQHADSGPIVAIRCADNPPGEL